MKLRTLTVGMALMASVTLTSCSDNDEAKNPNTGQQGTSSAPDIPTEFYLEPLYGGCDKFADLNTADLLGEKVEAVHTLDSSTDAACVWSLAGDDGSTPAAQVEVGVDMVNEDDIWTDYATFDTSDWWMSETKEVATADPFWGFASYWDWSNDSYSTFMQFNTTDTAGMLRLSCEYRGEPKPSTSEDNSYLIDEAASVEDDLAAFCTDALARAIVEVQS